ncbi:hypothetical protein [Pseudomonas solani]|uniref:hypothetical protein n=1 Tax=Pseudomonas solani TaxID=2731552 RepID=UPI003D6C0B00
MDTIRDGIDAYNQTYLEINGEDAELFTEGPASEEEIEQLASITGPLPAELQGFYRSLGALKNQTESDSHCFWIPAPAELADWLREQDGSAGIIDVIRAHWGGDRPEFDAGRHFSAEEIAALNERFIGYGWYRVADILEGAYFLFFDREGRFGSLYYHQDDFAGAKQALREMLRDGIKGQPLEQLLGEALEEVRASMEAFG